MKNYKERIVELVYMLEDEGFLAQLYTIIKCHIRRKGGR